MASHHDDSRKGVGATAHAVASLRSLEDKYGKDALFHDPYASLMGGHVGQEFLESNGSQFFGTNNPSGLIDGTAVRTKKIDDELRRVVADDNIRQICVLGAGLDTRPWRLNKTTEENVKYFEVDFAELFQYKLPLLQAAGAVSQFEYYNVIADLSLTQWYDALISAGFDITRPTVFVMEGFINYLTEEEAKALFSTITSKLAHRGSVIIATLLTARMKAVTAMHRFFPENPLSWLNECGWTGTQDEIEVLGVQYGRPIRDKSMEGYYIAVVHN